MQDVPVKKTDIVRRRENMWGYIFIMPQILGLFCFVLFPVAAAVYLCFTTWNFMDLPKLAGLQNFKNIINDEVFYKAIGNTFVYIITTVPFTIAISLGMAVLTNRKLRGRRFFRSMYFLPMITSSISIAMVWYWIYTPNYGVLNSMLALIGIKNGPEWLTNKYWAKIAIVIMSVWLKMGYYYIIFDAGLKTVPQENLEAACLDGANAWQRFWHVTFPMLSPVFFFVSVMLFIDVFNMFSETFVMTKGGPNYATYTLVMMVYFKAFGGGFNMGEASVVSMVLFAFVGVITYIQFKIGKRFVHYD